MEQMVIPGIYVSEQQYTLNPLKIDKRCLTAFAGITERGPVNRPVHLKSFDAYLSVFGGFDTAGVLPCSVYTYFKCGGAECIVTRVANTESARCASIHIPCAAGSFAVEALSAGHWGNYITVRVWHEKDSYFSMRFSYRGKGESYLHLSPDPQDERYFERYINSRSQLCRIKGGNHTGMVENVYGRMLRGGCDGIADLTAGAFIGGYGGPEQYSGIGCFESRDDISLVAAPDMFWLLSIAGKSMEEKHLDVQAVQQALIDQASRFPGRFAILDIPPGLDFPEAADWAKKLDTPFAAAYYPFIDVLDPLDPVGAKTIRIPPSGAICGCIVAEDNENGVFHAPANCVLQGAAGIAQKVSTGGQEVLYENRINMLRYFPGSGVKIWGARTLSSDPDWKYINVRRTFSRITAAIKTGTQWAVFEVNDKNLWKRLVRQVSGFLLDLWMEGYLAGSTAEQGFFVRCDSELNPPENIDDGILTFQVGVAIVKPLEFFKILITAEKDGASVYIQDE
jgi:uncharacterized protein